MYEYYSDVHDCEEPHFISLRDIVIHRKQPRKMFVQHNTQIQEGREFHLLPIYHVLDLDIIKNASKMFILIMRTCLCNIYPLDSTFI